MVAQTISCRLIQPNKKILNLCVTRHILRSYRFEAEVTFKCQNCHHIETSQQICCANQLTGFYVMTTLAFNESKKKKQIHEITHCGRRHSVLMNLLSFSRINCAY